MDPLTHQLRAIAWAVSDPHFNGNAEVPELTVLAGAVRRTRPVLAELLQSSSEPVVARQRAFAAAASVAEGFRGPRRAALSSALAQARVTTPRTPDTALRAA